MGRDTGHQFVSTDSQTLVAKLVAAYEQLTNISLNPASPEKLFISWVADIIIQERILNNYTGNQNIPSRAEGDNLDALGELFYKQKRPDAQPAVCTGRFHISSVQNTSILIPKGTRVTDVANTLVWETDADTYIPIGETYADIQLHCLVSGIIGNGYAPGQINTIIDLYEYYSFCENITTSDEGMDRATDSEYYEIMRASQDAYSDAGAKGGYIYFAKQVSTEIEDVVANSPSAGCVSLYVLMNGGAIATDEIKSAVLAACNPDTVRPLTDYVSVNDPETIRYDISFTYFVPSKTTLSSSEIEKAVDLAIKEYISWQAGKLGRDINPSYLIGRLMQTGIKRVELRKPSFQDLRDGNDNTTPQVAQIGDITIINGGYEDE